MNAIADLMAATGIEVVLILGSFQRQYRTLVD